MSGKYYLLPFNIYTFPWGVKKLTSLLEIRLFKVEMIGKAYDYF